VSTARRIARLRRRYRYQLADAAVILATIGFVAAAGAIGLWVLHTSLNG